ncbi:MAG: hypothetical protein ACRBCJ_02040 [Hyphomicrobiaceae bacterium]
MSLSGFRDDEHGAVAIFVAMVASVLLIGAGGAIDFSRWREIRTLNAQALDAAVLAGARTLLVTGDQTAAITAAQSYYDENLSYRPDVINNSVSFAVIENGTAVSGTGTADMSTTLLKMININELPLLANPQAAFPIAKINNGDGSHMEVALMLDVTGSMCDNGHGPCTNGTKMSALKTAAKDLVNIVVQDDQSNFTTRIALIPFSKRIRVAPNGGGAGIMKSLTNLDEYWSGWRMHCTQYSGATTYVSGSESIQGATCEQEEVQYFTDRKVIPCVTERFYDASGPGFTDEAPGPGKWLNGYDGRREPISRDSENTPPTDNFGLVSTDPAYHYAYNSGGVCWIDEANQIVPLTSDKMNLSNQIDSLVGYEETAGLLGTAFTWYLLSPNWSNIWNSATRPYSEVTSIQANGKPLLRKVAVIMSDGVYNSSRGLGGQDQQQLSDYSIQMCSNMKAQGIEIYTIGFQLDQLATSERDKAEATLRSCGSDVQHFYNTVNPEELQGAFRDIATRLSSIALTR